MVPCHAHLTALLFYRSSQQRIPQTTHGATSSDRLFFFCVGLPLFFALFSLCLPVCLPLRNYSLTHSPCFFSFPHLCLSFRVLLSHLLWNKWLTDITGDFIIRRFLRRFCSCFFTMWHWHQTGKRHGTILQWLISIWWCTTVWCNSDCKEAIRHRRKAQRQAEVSPTAENMEHFKVQRAKCRKTVRTSRRQSWQTFVSKNQ